jgi:hypothetical protein
MLTITMAQLDALAAPRRWVAAERLAETAVRHFPVQARFAGDAAVYRAAEAAMDRGRTVGCETKRDFAQYFLLVCLLGHDFATDPRHPWAAEWLAERPGTTLRFRLEHLVMLANGQLDVVQGADNGALVKSLLRIRRLAPADFLAGGAGSETCAAWLAALSPGWASWQDGLVPAAVARAAPILARSLGLDGAGPIATVAMHMMMLGHGFADDPLYPWAKAALAGDGPDRADRLFAASCRYIEAVLA